MEELNSLLVKNENICIKDSEPISKKRISFEEITQFYFILTQTFKHIFNIRMEITNALFIFLGCFCVHERQHKSSNRSFSSVGTKKNNQTKLFRFQILLAPNEMNDSLDYELLIYLFIFQSKNFGKTIYKQLYQKPKKV